MSEARRLLNDAELLAPWPQGAVAHGADRDAGRSDSAGRVSGPSALLTLWGRYPGWTPRRRSAAHPPGRVRWHNAVMTEETKAETTERIEVQRTIPADPARIFAVLRDPQGHVTIDSSGMLQEATGEPAAKVGAEFVVHMDRESLNDYPLGKYDVTIHITRFEPDRAIAWTILGQLNLGHVY